MNSTSIFLLLDYLNTVYYSRPGTRRCSHNRDFSEMIFNKLAEKKKWTWQCSYLTKVQSIIDNAAASLVKMLGLRIGNLWAERIRYYLYQHESRDLIANLNLLFEPTYFIDDKWFNGYDVSRRCQFFIDRDMLNILNKESIQQMHTKLKSFREETELRYYNRVFIIEKYRVPVFTDVYIPFLSEYFLYHSFVVLGYALTFKNIPVDFDFANRKYINRVVVGRDSNPWWISIEKNGLEIVIQSGSREDVTLKFKDKQRIPNWFVYEHYPELMERFVGLQGNVTFDQILLSIWETNELRKSYHFLFDNCQRFTNTIYDKVLRLKKDLTPNLETVLKNYELVFWNTFLRFMQQNTSKFLRITMFFSNCALLPIIARCTNLLFTEIDRRFDWSDMIHVLLFVVTLKLIVLAQTIALYLFWLFEDLLYSYVVALYHRAPMVFDTVYIDLTETVSQYCMLRWLYNLANDIVDAFLAF